LLDISRKQSKQDISGHAFTLRLSILSLDHFNATLDNPVSVNGG